MTEGRDWLLLAALGDVADLLEARYGSVDPAGYRLGDAKFTTLAGATGTGIDRGLVPTDGGESSINVSADSTFFDAQGGVLDQWVSPHGPIFRVLGEFDDDGTPRLRFSFPLGNVAEPDSPHWDDMQSDWLDGGAKTMLFRRDEIEAAEERRYTLIE
jgi:acyl-homoserine lactone acylase PvdQ